MQSDTRSRGAGGFVLWAEIFGTVNLLFLSLDIFLAHSGNGFLRRPEYIPLIFSLAAPWMLVAALVARRYGRSALWNWTGLCVGAASILVGIAGVIYHLDSQFFYERTLRALTYAAPFAAPLAYTGIGLILILNRMGAANAAEWSQWILFLTLGGFCGNFVLSLTDHATNGFFRWTEWIPVASSAFASTFLLMLFVTRPRRSYLTVCAAVLLVQALVGITGFALHLDADWQGVSRSLFQNVVNGAPPFAPLLFPNLALLGWIGIWVLRAHTVDE